VIVVGVGDRLLRRAIGHGGALTGGRVGEAFRRAVRRRIRASRDEAVQAVVSVLRRPAVVVKQGLQVTGGVVGPGLRLECRHGLLDQLVEIVEEVPGGVPSGVLERDQVAARVVIVGGGLFGIRAGGLDDGAELIRVVVGVVDGVISLVGDRGQIAGTVVGVLGGRLIVIDGLEEPAARVVLTLRLLALAIGDDGLVTGVVIGIDGGGALRGAVAGGDGLSWLGRRR